MIIWETPPGAKVEAALSELIASANPTSMIDALDADTGRALASYLRQPGYGLFFDPTRNHDGWLQPAPLSEQAMASLHEHLVRQDGRLIMLLTPPFDHTEKDPGYIKGYLPGVRENGAQYTHAALWAVLATALSGDGDRALELFQLLNPLMHARTPREVAEYKVEPYVVATDVYTASGHVGRGGWTWYTGSASWMYRVGLEAILGFRLEGDELVIDPCIPPSWPGFGIEYRLSGGSFSAAPATDGGAAP